jgi:hypothetical protein
MKKRKVSTQSLFATMAGFALLALSSNADAGGGSYDTSNQQTTLPDNTQTNAKGVIVTLQEVQSLKDGNPQYSSNGQPVVEYKIVSQEPANKSKTIVNHMDGTREVLDDETIKEIHSAGAGSGSHFGLVDFLIGYTMYNMMFGGTSYTPNPSHFADTNAYNRSRTMSPQMAANLRANREQEEKRRAHGSGTYIARSYATGSGGGTGRPGSKLAGSFSRQSLFAKASVSRGASVPSSGRAGFFSGARAGGMGA